MILEFEVENYRSIKERQVFSMIAESSKSKPNNVFEHQLANGDKIRLLKAAVVYGANASGKSNMLRAFGTLRMLITAKLSINDSILYYEPFLFDRASKSLPTVFILTFIGNNNQKFRYEIIYNNEEIFREKLDFYPKGKIQNLFKRISKKTSNNDFRIAKFGQVRNHKELRVFKNQLVLSKFGFYTPDDFFSPIYQYFHPNNYSILNPDIENNIKRFRESAEKHLIKNPELIPIVNQLIQIADTKIEGIVIQEKINNKHQKEKKHEVLGIHPIYDKQRKRIGTNSLSFDQQSKGTSILFSLGAAIIFKLKIGGLFIIDEIDTSLHPKLAKTLIQLFQSPIANLKNAQIIFTTHETAFLDKDLFRKDQIWFTEKNDYGETELFSIQDFDKVREDTPFDKWYMAGKFGGIPDIQAIEAIFSNGTAK